MSKRNTVRALIRCTRDRLQNVTELHRTVTTTPKRKWLPRIGRHRGKLVITDTQPPLPSANCLSNLSCGYPSVAPL